MITASTTLLEVAQRYADHPDDWPSAPRFDPRRRWYARLAEHADHEVWLLTWLPGQATDLHDHGGSAGAFVVVSGVLTEQTVLFEGAPSSAESDKKGPFHTSGAARLTGAALAAGTGRRFGSHHIHRISNAGDSPAVSVHVYGPALRAMTRYRIDGGVLELESVTRAGADW